MLGRAIALSVSLVLLHEPSCGGDVEPTSSGRNAPCTRSKDCRRGLACTAGVCTGEAPADGGPANGETDGDADVSDASARGDAGDGG